MNYIRFRTVLRCCRLYPRRFLPGTQRREKLEAFLLEDLPSFRPFLNIYLEGCEAHGFKSLSPKPVDIFIEYYLAMRGEQIRVISRLPNPYQPCRPPVSKTSLPSQPPLTPFLSLEGLQEDETREEMITGQQLDILPARLAQIVEPRHQRRCRTWRC